MHDFLNGVLLRHEIEVSGGYVLLTLENNIVSRSPNDHSHQEQFEKTMRGVCLLRAVHCAPNDPVSSPSVPPPPPPRYSGLIRSKMY